jgi:hypothetical protein
MVVNIFFILICSSGIKYVKRFDVRICRNNNFGTLTDKCKKENCTEMQLSLFHPLGTLSHRVNEGGPATIQTKFLRVPERETISKSI